MTGSKKIDDGGPAFPQLDVTACERDGHGDLIDPFTSVSGGMSLRDHFAGQALIALGTWMPVPSSGHPSLHNNDTLKSRADIAYRQADAMLLARKAGGE